MSTCERRCVRGITLLVGRNIESLQFHEVLIAWHDGERLRRGLLKRGTGTTTMADIRAADVQLARICLMDARFALISTIDACHA